jgi:hypothetical protein
MSTTAIEEKQNLTTAISYYQAMVNNDFDKLECYLNQDVRLISPLSEITGKTNVINAAKNFAKLLKDIDIKSNFAQGNKIILVYNMHLQEPINSLRAVTLMDLKQAAITKIELFYDARPFESFKNKIFT